MKQFYVKSTAALLLLVVNIQFTSGQYNVYHDVISSNQLSAEDLDPDDGFDFVEMYEDQMTLKMGELSCGALISHEIVDGGSRTVYLGPNIRLLRFQDDLGHVFRNLWVEGAGIGDGFGNMFDHKTHGCF